MSGFKRNFVELANSIGYFTEVPFSLLPLDKQALISKNLSNVFSNILTSLEKDHLEKTIFYTNVLMLVSATKNGVDEQKFYKYIKLFLDALATNKESLSAEALNPIAEKFFTRVQPFYVSEIQAMKYRDSHKTEEIVAHDTEVINKVLQIYALDYFLLAYKNLISSTDKRAVIFLGVEKAPAIAEDALADDMLKKVVYSLYDKDIRKKMIYDYYVYKQAFLSVSKNSITEEDISRVIEALRIYCLSLIEISLENGVQTLKYSLLEPYGPNADLLEIKKQISNATR